MPGPSEHDTGEEALVGHDPDEKGAWLSLAPASGPLLAAQLSADPTLADLSSPRRGGGRRLGWGFFVAVAWVLGWILLALLAGVLPLPRPDSTSLSCFADASPSAAHLLGCDNIGRDILSRVIFGSRVSLVVGFASIAAALVVGGALGLVAGYLRGIVDTVVSIASTVFLAFPTLVLALLIVSYVGSSEFDIVMIIALLAWPVLFRVVRATTIEHGQRDYVLAARALGATRGRILLRYLLPDVVPSAITYGLIGVSLAIVAEGALSFLGLSVAAPTPTWGNMIEQATSQMPNYLSLLLSPTLAMFSFILAVNFIGDRLRSVFDLRQGTL